MSSPIKTIIIEDDPTSFDYLSSTLLSNFKEIKIIGSSDSVIEAIDLINTLKPELIFMDIELRDGLSFDIFSELKFHDFEVIFVTAYHNFLKTAIDHYAFSFVSKPYEPKKIIEIVNRYTKLKDRLFSMNKFNSLSNYLKEKDARLLLNLGQEHVSVKVSDIVKCTSEGNYTYFHMRGGEKYLVSHLLKYYEALLTDKGFFKAHRSTLINTAHIQSIYKKETIILSNNDKIIVSVRNRSNLTDLINSLS